MTYKATALIFCTLLVVSAYAQNGPCTENAVRAGITEAHPWPKTKDYYLFNPLLDKPVVGVEERQNSNKANEPLMAKRKNMKTVFKIERIVVASSSDMAYEYGTQVVSYDESDTGKHVDITLARLSVWKADGGSCKAAAAMLEREESK